MENSLLCIGTVDVGAKLHKKLFDSFQSVGRQGNDGRQAALQQFLEFLIIVQKYRDALKNSFGKADIDNAKIIRTVKFIGMGVGWPDKNQIALVDCLDGMIDHVQSCPLADHEYFIKGMGMQLGCLVDGGAAEKQAGAAVQKGMFLAVNQNLFHGASCSCCIRLLLLGIIHEKYVIINRFFYKGVKFMSFLFVEYPKCTTCQKAKKWLEENNIAFEDRHILENRPTAAELREWHELSGLSLSRLFNSSGQLYRKLDLKSRLPGMTDEEKYNVLAEDGMLVKRPLLIGEGRVLAGFRQAEWEALISKG